mgnify:CR=1 FL=1
MARHIILFLCWGAIFSTSISEAAPKKQLWERWLEYSPESQTIIDHQSWNTFLSRNVLVGRDGINRIDYANVPDADRKNLKYYIEYLGAVTISRYRRSEQLAYWLNLYNALTVRLVIKNYPIQTIKEVDISPGFFADGPWGKKLFKVEDVPISLNDIEHRILRPIWQDPRIHYLINCASIGCPNLQPIALTGRNVSAILEAAAREFINHPRAVSYDGGRLVLSKLYQWYAVDFGEDDESIIFHITQFANPRLKERLKQLKSIADFDYDWSLNKGQL